jgi:hypothetical protein
MILQAGGRPTIGAYGRYARAGPEGAGVAVHPVEDVLALKLSPFVRRAIESHLLPLLAAGPRSSPGREAKWSLSDGPGHAG